MGSAAEVLDGYGDWLDRQALAARTRSAYRRWVAELLEHLVAGEELDAFLAPAGDDDRRAVLVDWRRRLVGPAACAFDGEPRSGRRDVASRLARAARAGGPPCRGRPERATSAVAGAAA